jgi:hypothetical protein
MRRPFPWGQVWDLPLEVTNVLSRITQRCLWLEVTSASRIKIRCILGSVAVLLGRWIESVKPHNVKCQLKA